MNDNIETNDEKFYRDIQHNFYEKFETKIEPKVYPIELERREKLKLAHFLSGLIAISGIILFFFGSFGGSTVGGELVCLSVFCFLMVFLPKKAIAQSFEYKIKKLVMPLVCSCYGTLYWGNGTYKGNTSLLKKACVIPSFDIVYYDDIFGGTHKGITFEIIEGKYTWQTPGKINRIVTVFNGVILKVKLDKNFLGHTVLCSDSDFRNLSLKELKRVTLKDVKFEDKFDVFTDDEIEARYLITPSFMERLKNIKTAFFANAVRCAFYHGFLFIALSTPKDLFSLCSLDKPVDDFKQYNVLCEEIISIIKLIDYFKLDEKIGL